MVKENIRKKLIIAICIVVFLLGVCITVDYADQTITDKSQSDALTNLSSNNITVINGTYYVLPEGSGVVEHNNKTYTEKPKTPTVSIVAKPSCGCRHKYVWHKRTYIDYCPHCHRYGVLRNVHKRPARFEQELTCLHCGADYCGVCGKEKYSWSRYYLRKAG